MDLRLVVEGLLVEPFEWPRGLEAEPVAVVVEGRGGLKGFGGIIALISVAGAGTECSGAYV